VDIIVKVKDELAKKTHMKQRFEAELAKLKWTVFMDVIL
jgi:hypothetical protein